MNTAGPYGPSGGERVNMYGELCNEKYAGEIQTEILIYQSKATLDEKRLFGKVTNTVSGRMAHTVSSVE